MIRSLKKQHTKKRFNYDFNICHLNINLLCIHLIDSKSCISLPNFPTQLNCQHCCLCHTEKPPVTICGCHPGCHNRSSPKKERLPKTNSVTLCSEMQCSAVKSNAEGRPLAAVSLCVETSQCQATLGPWGQFGNILARRKFYFWQKRLKSRCLTKTFFSFS